MNLSLFLTIHYWLGRSGWLDYLLVFLAVYSGWILIVFLPWYAFFKSTPRKRLMFLEAIASAIVSRLIITKLIRLVYHHPRPFDALSNVVNTIGESGTSFPSGHAALFFALSISVWLYNRRLGWTFLAVSVVMGLARIAVGAHWPLDILGGMAVAFISSAIVHYFAKKSFGQI